MASPVALIVPAVKRHTATIIMAHGLGDTGAGWAFLAENWRRRGKFEDVKFVFPNAPHIPITVNGGYQMPGWYDILGFDDLTQRQDETGVLRSRDYLASLVKNEVDAGIPSTRIVLGGFSQGGAMALVTGITSPIRLGGCFGLSSYLLLHDKLKQMVPGDAPCRETTFFMGHGDMDPLVRHQWGFMSASIMKEMGFKVDFRTYAGLAHSADPDEVDDLETYIEGCLVSN